MNAASNGQCVLNQIVGPIEKKSLAASNRQSVSRPALDHDSRGNELIERHARGAQLVLHFPQHSLARRIRPETLIIGK
jgi:hypothetical protein